MWAPSSTNESKKSGVIKTEVNRTMPYYHFISSQDQGVLWPIGGSNNCNYELYSKPEGASRWTSLTSNVES